MPKKEIQFEDYQEEQYTTWHNPLDREVRIPVFVNNGGEHGRGITKWHRVSPGGSIRLPKELDTAIRVERDGLVQGGLAPMLQKLDGENPPVHKALVPEEYEREKQLRAAAEALAEAKRSEEAFIMAQAKLKELNKQEPKQEKHDKK